MGVWAQTLTSVRRNSMGATLTTVRRNGMGATLTTVRRNGMGATLTTVRRNGTTADADLCMLFINNLLHANHRHRKS